MPWSETLSGRRTGSLSLRTVLWSQAMIRMGSYRPPPMHGFTAWRCTIARHSLTICKSTSRRYTRISRSNRTSARFPCKCGAPRRFPLAKGPFGTSTAGVASRSRAAPRATVCSSRACFWSKSSHGGRRPRCWTPVAGRGNSARSSAWPAGQSARHATDAVSCARIPCAALHHALRAVVQVSGGVVEEAAFEASFGGCDERFVSAARKVRRHWWAGGRARSAKSRYQC